MAEDELNGEDVVVIDAPHPRTGKITAFIMKDTALQLYDRQQKTFVDIMQKNHDSLEHELRDGFAMVRKIIMLGMTSMTIFIILAFAILALLVGGKTSVTTPGGATVEVGPGH